MKKLFLLLFGIALLTSCSDDDDVSGDDRILGTWFIAEVNGLPGFELDDCNQESFITFNSDNTTYSEYYTRSGESCTLEDNTNSVWEVDGEVYTFTIPFQNLGEFNGNVSFNSDVTEFTFTPQAVPTASIVFEKR